jgi:hypothetical protein
MRTAPMTINAIRPMCGGFRAAIVSSARAFGGLLWSEQDDNAKTAKARTESTVDTFPVRISIAAATVSEYVTMNEPIGTPGSPGVGCANSVGGRSRRFHPTTVSSLGTAARRAAMDCFEDILRLRAPCCDRGASY